MGNLCSCSQVNKEHTDHLQDSPFSKLGALKRGPFTEEDEAEFQKNLKFFQMKRANLANQIERIKAIVKMSQYCKGIQLEEYLGQLEGLGEQLQQVRIDEQSFNELQSSQAEEKQKEECTMEADIFKIQKAVAKLQENWEGQVVVLEQEFEREVTKEHIKKVIEYIKVSKQINEDPLSQKINYTTLFAAFNIDQEQLQVSTSIQYAHDISLFQEIFPQIQQQIASFLIQKFSAMLGRLSELKITEHYLSSFLLPLKENEFYELKKQAEIKATSQPQLAQFLKEQEEAADDVIFYCKKKLDELKQLIMHVQQQILGEDEHDLEIQSVLKYLQTNEEVESHFEEGDNQISEIKSLIYEKLIAQLFLIRNHLNRNSLHDYITKLLEENADLATELSNNDQNIDRGMKVEGELQNKASSLQTMEEQKGFLQDEDIEPFLTELYQIQTSTYIPFTQEKDDFFIKQDIQTQQDLIKQFSNSYISYITKIFQLMEEFIYQKEQFLKFLRDASNQLDISSQKEVLYQKWKLILSVQGQLQKAYKENVVSVERKLKRMFWKAVEHEEIEEEQEELKVLEDKMKDFFPEQVSQFIEKNIGSKGQKNLKQLKQQEALWLKFGAKQDAIILSESYTLVDQLMLKVIDFEQDISSRQQIIRTPVLFKTSASNEKEAIYQLEMPKMQQGIGFEGLEFKKVSFKAKVIEDDCVAIKMKSGAYIFADRMGAYFQELQMQENYGFQLSDRKK